MGAVSSQCQSCGSSLASDQRYCLVCGERRGKARFSLGALTPAPAAPVAVPARPRGPRISSGVAFISFVAVLLLAMGVGVLIGHTNNAQPVQRADAPRVNVSVQGGGSGNGSNASNNKSSGAKAKSTKTTAAKAPPLAKKVVVKAQAAAAAVLGGKNLPPPTVTVGQKGTGAGFQNGHFTGNFFGGG
ncbi:MAG: hypothetical protein QOG59_381 [Solirubrobacteraceae bacterium]|jgi:hypothetical protein|nr:hypothetical protein [Solirubrobacteraceae bacterium]